MNNKQGLIIAAVLVVAAGIAFVAMRGNAPSTGTEGAIGAANRYAEKQITSEDVALTDADVQSFLQSDAFRAMQTNPDFRKLVTADRSETNRAVGTGGPRFIELVNTPGFGKFIVDRRFVPNKKFTTLVKQKEFVELVSTAEAGQVATLEAYTTLARTQGVALSTAALDKNFTELLKNEKFLEFMAEVERSKISSKAELDRMSTPAAREVMASKAYQGVAKSEFFNALMLDKSFQTLANNKAFLELYTSERYATLARSSGSAIEELAANGALGELASNQQYQELLKNPVAVELITSDEVGRLALDRSFLELVEMENVGQLLEKSEVQSMITAASE